MTTPLITAASAGALFLLASRSHAALGDPVVKGGVTYTTSNVDDQGCLLYSVSRPEGAVSTAIVYRGRDREFSLARPRNCVERTSEPRSSG